MLRLLISFAQKLSLFAFFITFVTRPYKHSGDLKD